MICLSYLFYILCIDGKIDEKANKYSLTGNEFSPSSKSTLDQSNRKSLPATEDLDVITVDGDIEEQLAAYEARRKPRVGLVVANTLKLVDLEIAGGPAAGEEAGKIMGMTLGALAATPA